MTLLGQNQREAQRPIAPIVAPKQQTTIRCWNVRTTAEATRTAQVAMEMAEEGIEVLGISETKRKGNADGINNTAEWSESGVRRR